MNTGTKHSRKLRIGFVPLNDCAPLVMAQELGLFTRHGLRVELSRELGWATVRDKIIFGELDAAHALCALPFATTLGLGSVRCPCVAGLVLNQHGNAITLSCELHQRGVRDAQSLRAEILRVRRTKTFTFGITFPASTHHFILRQWLSSGGIQPERDVRIVVVPPPQMFAHLQAGHLDGYSVGEPWNSAAVQAGAGWCVATSAELAPAHPEKVLMVRRDFAAERAGEHLTLIAALREACAFCDRPENRESILATLGQREYLHAPTALLRPGFSGEFDFGHGRTERLPDFNVFSGGDTNAPTPAKAAWIQQHLLATGLVKNPADLNGLAAQVFRADIFNQAAQLLPANSKTETNHEIENETELVSQ